MTSMYQLPEVVPTSFPHMDNDVKMYKLPVINHTFGEELPVSSPLETLEARQESILSRLNQLQIRVNKMQGSEPRQTVSNQLEIVVHASPLNPPYSLPLMIHYLQKGLGYKLFTTNHLHSSYTKKLPQKLEEFLPTGSSSERADADLRIALIWKDVGVDPVSVVGLLPKSSVKGEVNLLRFVARHFGLFDSQKDDWKEDETLDRIHSELIWGDVVHDKKAVMAQAETMAKTLSASKTVGLSSFLMYSAAKILFAKPPPAVASFVRAFEDFCNKSLSDGHSAKNLTKLESIKTKKVPLKEGRAQKERHKTNLIETREKTIGTLRRVDNTFHFEWPSIPCLYCRPENLAPMAKYSAIAPNLKCFISEKLNGSAMALGSTGFVATRTKVLIQSNPSQSDLLNTTFMGHDLSSLQDLLLFKIKTLRRHLQDVFQLPFGLEVILYGEWMHYDPEKDNCFYLRRELLPGHFYAYGIGIYVQYEDCLDDTLGAVNEAMMARRDLGFRKCVARDSSLPLGRRFYWVSPINFLTYGFMGNLAIPTVPAVGYMDLLDAFNVQSVMLMLSNGNNGLVIHPELVEMPTLKWLVSNYNCRRRHRVVVIDKIRKFLRKANPARDWSDLTLGLECVMTQDAEKLLKSPHFQDLAQQSVLNLHTDLCQHFSAAVSKSCLERENTKPLTPRKAVDAWFDNIERLMLGDLKKTRQTPLYAFIVKEFLKLKRSKSNEKIEILLTSSKCQ